MKAICHPQRRYQHRLFAGQAQWVKSSTGWFFGFKLHVVFNHRGQLLNLALTPATSMIGNLYPSGVRPVWQAGGRPRIPFQQAGQTTESAF